MSAEKMEGHVTQVRIVSQFLGAVTTECASIISLIESRSRVNSYLSGYDLGLSRDTINARSEGT